MMGESPLLQLLVTAPPNPSVGSAASITSTNEDDICRFRCRSRAQRGRPRAHGQHTGPPLSWATRQLRGHAGSPRPEGQSWSRGAGSLWSLAQQPWGPLRAPPRPDSTLHSSQGGFAAQPHACSAALESEPGGSSVGGRWA